MRVSLSTFIECWNRCIQIQEFRVKPWVLWTVSLKTFLNVSLRRRPVWYITANVLQSLAEKYRLLFVSCCLENFPNMLWVKAQRRSLSILALNKMKTKYWHVLRIVVIAVVFMHNVNGKLDYIVSENAKCFIVF